MVCNISTKNLTDTFSAENYHPTHVFRVYLKKSYFMAEHMILQYSTLVVILGLADKTKKITYPSGRKYPSHFNKQMQFEPVFYSK